ncbi:MAG: diaminopimelate decarboxylase [Prevotellaceae bacterium]|nr:diaminopimelate decarboxylase [Prevotellaceae bacterium]
MNLPVDSFKHIETPFYYYDIELLQQTLDAINREASKHRNFVVHYAVKANANHRILEVIRNAGLGADCVSGGEIQASLDAGFSPSGIVFAGVGKSDWEINLGLDSDILCFNVESIAELEVINELACKKGRKARVALRINPEIGAHTHANITTGTAENKFGIAMLDLGTTLELAGKMDNIEFKGLHFHIGSQILDMNDFRSLCNRINDLQRWLEIHNIKIDTINVGGGLGVEYHAPDHFLVPDFKAYFETFANHLELRPHQQLHFELGRAVVAQCGTMLTKVLYVKQGVTKQFACVDAGFTDLIRPALYQAYHRIENLNTSGEMKRYDIVGPICESTDVFAKSREVNECHRGDLLAIRTAGAYGEIMASQYNCRRLPKAVYSDTI